MIRYSNSGKQVRIPAKFVDGTSIHVPVKHWRNGKVSQGFNFASIINQRLAEIAENIDEICYSLLTEGITPLPYLIKEKFAQRKKILSVVEAFKEYIDAKDIEYESKKQYYIIHRRLLELEPLTYASFNANFPKKFQASHWGNNYFRQNLMLLAEFLRYAYHEGNMKTQHFENWNVKREHVFRYSLTIDEIRQLVRVELQGTQDEYRDILLFLCFSGMRISETQQEFKIEKDILFYQRAKGRVKNWHSIKLTSILKQILDKYEGKLPTISSTANVNREIKNIAAKAGINSLVDSKKGLVEKSRIVTTHIGRRTFVTLAREAGIAPDLVQRSIDHSSQQMTALYDQSTAKIAYSIAEVLEKEVIKQITK